MNQEKNMNLEDLETLEELDDAELQLVCGGNIIDDIKKITVDKIVAFERELADIAQ